MAKRHYRRLGPATGLSDFGVSHVTLEPGGVSSQRHWHEDEDEFVVMLEGEAVLEEEGGETALRPGDCASFPKGVANGHRLVNRSGAPCVFIAIGRLAVERLPLSRHRPASRRRHQPLHPQGRHALLRDSLVTVT